jgi:cellulose synthase/poly-beta-1,6-N-acetylglucosamine synthase-like glycosyltransferase
VTTAIDLILWCLVASPAVLVAYAYVIYPMLLGDGGQGQARAPEVGADTSAASNDALPLVTVTLPAYNEERRLAAALDAVLASDYPRAKLHVVVVSDASTDRTDEIARAYADRGVELLRLPTRQGKTAGENASRAVVRGDIVINTDASVRVAPGAIRALARAFADPTVGVASGHDVSVSADVDGRVQGEGSYVDFEMQLRQRETARYGIVGASGCLFAIRRALHAEPLPETLSRDFASALVAREHGYRAVSVPSAHVYVPRAGALGAEYRRKVRTMARGLRTLWFKRHLLNPWRYGFFAFALWSHKVARWAVYPAAALALLALALLAMRHEAIRYVLAAALVGIGGGALAMRRVDRTGAGRLLRLVAFAYAANVAGLMAWWEFLRGHQTAVWEPTRRPG